MDVVHALAELRPNAQWSVEGYEYSGIVWKDTEQTKPTEKEVIAKCKEIEARILPIYQRIEAYPPIKEQLDMLYWDKVNGTNHWQTMITEIKEKYPKLNEGQ